MADVTVTITEAITNVTVTEATTTVTIGELTSAATTTIAIVDPSSAPTSVGQWYYNSLSNRAWFSVAATSVSDWKEVLISP